MKLYLQSKIGESVKSGSPVTSQLHTRYNILQNPRAGYKRGRTVKKHQLCVTVVSSGGSGKMYVPSDSFGGVSPERKASELLRTLHTFIAARIVLAQLEGSGRGSLASYNTEFYATLKEHLEDVPMKNGDEWLSTLLQKNRMLGIRIAEVRAAYAETDFEWEQVRRLALSGTRDANVELMRESLKGTTWLE
uniref:Chaperonin-like protein n=1 Tax=Tetraselmis sp. GSL018 TaxID=582737 RepID=A0A061QQA7_9CHLO